MCFARLSNKLEEDDQVARQFFLAIISFILLSDVITTAFIIDIISIFLTKGLGCLPFTWKTWDFQLENQMVRIIRF